MAFLIGIFNICSVFRMTQENVKELDTAEEIFPLTLKEIAIFNENLLLNFIAL